MILESAARPGCPVILTLKGSGTRTGNTTALYRLLSNEQSSLQDMTDHGFHKYRYREVDIICFWRYPTFLIYLSIFNRPLSIKKNLIALIISFIVLSLFWIIRVIIIIIKRDSFNDSPINVTRGIFFYHRSWDTVSQSFVIINKADLSLEEAFPLVTSPRRLFKGHSLVRSSRVQVAGLQCICWQCYFTLQQFMIFFW